MHKISKTLSVISLLAPVGAGALGIGDIQLHSALNQGFDAEIPLLTSATNVSDIHAALASPGAFARAGIDRHYFLSNLHFKPIIKPNGRVVIKVTSGKAVQEPFLNFLVEVRSPKGRALKEFTVLLDPPSSFHEPAVKALPSGTVTGRAPVVAHTPKSSPIKRKSAVAPKTSKRERSSTRRSPKPSVQSGMYGPTVRNDTLSRVAARVNRDRSISMEQMMVALYRANPGAFYKHNVNALKAGVNLKVPTRAEVLAIPAIEAADEIRHQHVRWSGLEDEPMVAKRSLPSAKQPQQKVEPVTKDAAGKPIDAKASAKPEPVAQLKLAAPVADEPAGGLASGAASGQSAKKAEQAFEMAETLAQENEDLRGRLAELEKQLSSMQRLLSMKDDQLSALQSDGRQEKSVQPAADKSAAGERTEQPAASPVQAAAPLAGPGESNDTVKKTKAQPAFIRAKKPVRVPQPRPVTAPAQQEDGWLSELLSDPVYLAAGGGGIVFLALLGWLALRRKRAGDGKAESILAAPETERTSELEEWGLPVLSDSHSSKSTVPVDGSFLSEFAPSDFDALDSDQQEVDAIAEADVYLAYGRYQQAEELIRQAIEAEPSNNEYKLKLFEILYAAENSEAFERYASEVRTECEGSGGGFWEKVSEMGREICPKSPLFQPEAETGGDDLSESFDLNDALDDRGDTVYDLSVPDFDQPTSGDDAPTEEIAIDPEDQLLSDSVSGLEASAEEAEGLLGQASELDPSVHGDESLGARQLEWSEDAVEAMLSPSQDVAEEFNVLPNEEAVEGDSEFGSQSAQAGESLTLELVDVVAPEASSVDSVQSPDAEADEASYANLTEMSEVETKLDLAKAYLEMDDSDSANDILQEVLVEGNDEQRNEAQSIAAGLGAK